MSEVKKSLSFTHILSASSAAKMGLLGLCLILSQQSALAAEQEWWFDVEVIIFKRDANFNELSEKFSHQTINTQRSEALDLLSRYLRPDISYLRAGLDFCRPSSRAEKQRQFEQDFAFPVAIEHVDSDSDSDEINNESPAAVRQSTEQNANTSYNSDEILAPEPEAPQLNLSPEALAQTTRSEMEEQNAAIYIPQDVSVNWLEWQVPTDLPCVYKEQLALLANPFVEPEDDDLSLKNIHKVPVKIDGINWQRKGQAFLLPQNALNLQSLFTSINRQPDLQSMLYLGWRQEVEFGSDKATAVRLFAGLNYGNTYANNGHLKPLNSNTASNELSPYLPLDEHVVVSEQQHSTAQYDAAQVANAELFSQIEQTLKHNDGPLVLDSFFAKTTSQASVIDSVSIGRESESDIWQLDGELKVYLQNVGRTPYLHVDSNFDFRQSVFDPSLHHAPLTLVDDVVLGDHNTQANKLESIRVTHFKRVISKQLHYFDHPLFGMLVYITRYQWPEEPAQPEAFN